MAGIASKTIKGENELRFGVSSMLVSSQVFRDGIRFVLTSKFSKVRVAWKF